MNHILYRLSADKIERKKNRIIRIGLFVNGGHNIISVFVPLRNANGVITNHLFTKLSMRIGRAFVLQAFLIEAHSHARPQKME